MTFTTTPNGGGFAPKNVVAVWIEKPGGVFVKTIGRWSATRTVDLVAWGAKAPAGDVDAVSGATRANSTPPLTVTWNLKDKALATVPDGTYTIRMELSDANVSTAAQNHQGTFTFIKGPSPQTQTALTNGGFINVSINFTPISNPALCGNGTLDPGETCDPVASCPTTCAASTDACAPNVLVGTAAACTAACEVQQITACVNGDGCCAAGCDSSTDSDCAAGQGPGSGPGSGSPADGQVMGGCSTQGSGSGGGSLLLIGAFGALLLASRRRRS